MGKLYVAAPQGRSWPIDLDAAEASLREHWPDALMSRQDDPVAGGQYLTFDVVVAGQPRYGTYAATRSCLTLAEGTPADWAETIAWFLGLLPSGTPAIALAEENPDQLVPVPSPASTEDIRALYERLAE